jgi:hypothetical protein
MKPMQKSIVLASVLLALGLSCGASAQDRKTNTTLPPVQAPPGLDDAGSKEVALPTPQQEAKSAVTETQANPAARQIENSGMPPDVQAEANAAELPVVTVRQQGTETVEEYRKHGKLVFVRVISDNGPAKYYVDNPSDVPRNMQQLSGPSGVVQPVYYKLFDWK